MNSETLEALKGSIQKWHDIVYHGGADYQWTNCPLCVLFINSIRQCENCPVMQETGHPTCYESPYSDWAELHSLNGVGWRVETPEQRRAALAELKFLVTLLPQGKTAKMSDGWIWYWSWK